MVVNLLFITAVGLIYAPLAPLVAMGACCVFWFSSVVVSGVSSEKKKKKVRADEEAVQVPVALCVYFPSGERR